MFASVAASHNSSTAVRSAAISSTSAQMMLADLLFMGLVQQDLERAPDRIRHSEALVKKLV